MRGETILIIDDEKLIRWSLNQELTRAGFQVLEADTIRDGITFLNERDPDLVVLDQLLPDGTGIDLLTRINTGRAIPPVIMLTALDKANVAVQAMKLGAFEYCTKPVDIDELKIVIEKALEATQLRRQVAHFLRAQDSQLGFFGLTGESEAMKEVFERIIKVASSKGTTVLITGESGTGKELVARAIHFLSDRKDKPLINLNCSALSETLIESELFGHEKGAFTDARSQKKGIFALAEGGSIFLDEIGDITAKIQVKLLRVLETKTFQRVGGTTDIQVDARIIAATNQPLEQWVANGRFRSDLYFRLNVARILIPPLRERGDDIIRLAECFMQEYNVAFHKKFREIAPETRRLLLQYHWPGNVRELKNALERAMLLGDGEVLKPSHIEFTHLRTSHRRPELDISASGMSLDDLEREALIVALKKADYNKSRAARLLRISRDELRYKIKKHNLESPARDKSG